MYAMRAFRQLARIQGRSDPNKSINVSMTTSYSRRIQCAIDDGRPDRPLIIKVQDKTSNVVRSLEPLLASSF